MVRILIAIRPGKTRDTAEGTLAPTGARLTRANTTAGAHELAQATGFDVMVIDDGLVSNEARYKLSRRQPNAELWLLTTDVTTPALQRHADFLFLKPLDAVILAAKFEHTFVLSRIKNPR